MSPQPQSGTLMLLDGSKLGYDIFGSEHLLGGEGKLPLIFICGMSSAKVDWDRLTAPLSTRRPVLVFDNRGIGDSTSSTPVQNDDITVEIMARDLCALVEHLGWKEVDILGFSMGGVILQQMLLILGHLSPPTPLPFRVHHALLAATLCSPVRLNLPAQPLTSVSPLPRTVEQRKALVRPFLDACFGPEWAAQTENQERYQLWLERSIHQRPAQTIAKQRKALGEFDFRQELGTISPSTKVLIIHGKRDLIIPFSSGMQIRELIPHARLVEVGPNRGQVPSYDFGHLFFEYFDVEIWTGVIEVFLDDKLTPSENARL